MEKIGEANYFENLNRYPELRRKTRIKSIYSSLAIENNQLSLFQVEDVINGKMVIGEQKDIHYLLYFIMNLFLYILLLMVMVEWLDYGKQQY